MKVLFTFGGMPHYLVALLNKISSKNIDIVVVQPRKSGQTIGKGVKQISDNKNFKTIYLQEYNTILGKPYFRNLRKIVINEKPNLIVIGWPYILNLSFDFKLLNFIKKSKIGLLFREIPFMVAPRSQVYTYYKKYPIIDEELNNITPRGVRYYIWAFLLMLVRKRYYKLIDATLAYSSKAFEVQLSYGVQEENVFVTNNSPNTELLFKAKKKLMLSQESLNYNPFRLIHVGRLVKWKRVDLIIEILPRLVKKFPRTELIIIGNGPEESLLKAKVKKNELEKYVKFLGGIYNYNELGKYLLSSGIYVLAGMGGLSINEAMAFGKPIICSICDGTEKDLVKDGINGLYFKDGDSTSLYECIEQLFSDTKKIEEMGKVSELIIKQKININTVSEKFINAFKIIYNQKNNLL